MYKPLSRGMCIVCTVQRLQSHTNMYMSKRNDRECFCRMSYIWKYVYLLSKTVMSVYYLSILVIIFLLFTVINVEPCNPSPCGPNSQCRPITNQPVCSCLPTFIGTPPSCHPECTISAECPLNEACNNQKCINPCLGSCGYAAKCEVINHNPICSCPAGYTGDPFMRCTQTGNNYIYNMFVFRD